MNTTNGFEEYRYHKTNFHQIPKLAFKFVVNYSQVKDVPSSVRFSYAICNDKDNFCRATARSLLDERMENDNVIVGNFLGKSVSLINTAKAIVDDLIETYENDSDFKDISKKDVRVLRKFNNLKKLRDSFYMIDQVKEFENQMKELLLDDCEEETTDI